MIDAGSPTAPDKHRPVGAPMWTEITKAPNLMLAERCKELFGSDGISAVIPPPGHELTLADSQWINIGDTRFHIGLAVDSLTAMMLVVVTSVSLLVQVYSTGYMAGDGGYSRYFAYMSLFTTSMLGLVLA